MIVFFSIIPVHHKYSLGNIKLLSLNYYSNSKFKSVSVNFCELNKLFVFNLLLLLLTLTENVTNCEGIAHG